ncbi:MAG: AarF/ABC1/UbiB kinase family protein [Planctomycetota bacterium]|jgi:ubiquinone biosynthesis protein
MSKLVFSLLKGGITSFYNFLFTFDKNRLLIDFVETLSKDNIFYIKIFQGIGSNTNIFNEKQSEYLKKFLDKVPYKISELYDELNEELNKVGEKNEELKIDLDTLEIINSGIIGIVYKAKMNNKTIVIKVIKNNIRKKIYDALNEYEKIIKVLKYFSLFKFYYIDDIFYSNKELLLKQLDFMFEVENMKIFYENNKHTDYIEIPYVYEEFTKNNNKIIVMDYLDGKKLNEIEEEDKDNYLEQLVNFSFKSILFNRTFHCDLHPGNIIFLDNPKRLGIIDYGIIGEITKEEQENIYKFFNEIFKNKNYKEGSKILINNCSKVINDDTYVKYNEDIIQKLAELTNNLVNDKINLDANFIYKVNKVLYKENLKLAEFFCKIELSFGISDSVCKQLLKNSNLIHIARNMFEKLNI